ncbi:MAG: hypothetical protein A3C55_00395 [Gammaproteobacteria bacterium RIFCSPHIGHO2_02_FULL_42_13]|nr:MAG: hypothetical protein A3C55_00395 [Gammaproteobacteria bacterium RIFCSPHIGHO2_02_FULL_42_13]
MNSSKKTYWLDCLFLTVLFGVLYSLFLGHYALMSPDEGRYAEIGREMMTSGHYLVPRLNHVLYFEKPPLFYWLTALSLKLFGLNEWGARLWSVIFSIIGCLITYIVAHVYYDRKTGLFAAGILGTSLLYFTIGHMVTIDMTVSIFITATLAAFLLGIQTPIGLKRRGYFYLAALCAALAVLTKGLIGFAFPIMIIGLWIILLNKWAELKTWYLPTTILIALLIAAPWHIYMQTKYPIFFNFYFITQQFSRYATTSAQRQEPFYFYTITFLLGFFPWSVFVIQSIYHAWPRWKHRHQRSIEIFLLIWFFSILLFFSFSQSQLIPYIIPLFPPAAILTARYFMQNMPKTRGLNAGFIILLLFAFCASVGLILIPHYYPAARPRALKHDLIITITALLITTLIAYIVYWRRKFRPALMMLMIGTGVIAITLLLAMPNLDNRSTKPLANIIMRQIKSTDEVFTYNHYDQDLPFYTNRRIGVVDCAGELDFGINQENDSSWMMHDDVFWQRWENGTRIFVVTELTDYQMLIQQYPHIKFYILGKTSRNILFSNQPNH